MKERVRKRVRSFSLSIFKEHMRYFGGKQRIAKEIVNVMQPYIYSADLYLEPFVGSGAVIAQVNHDNRIGSDANEALVTMHNALLNGWIPPEHISEEEYKNLKKAKDVNDPLTAFAGFGCSFSGKWFGGYARDSKDDHSNSRSYAKSTKTAVLKTLNGYKGASFVFSDYRAHNPENAVIYCDPPYQGTTKYDAVGAFDSVAFWDWVREQSKKNVVFVSEYTAPDDFEVVWKKEIKTLIRGKDNVNFDRLEKLFKLK